MTFADLFSLYLITVFIILDIEECVSVIILQLVLLSFSIVVILLSPNVYISITIPPLPLSIRSPPFVYLSWIALPSWHISQCLLWVYILCVPISIEPSVITAICWSPVLHAAEWISISISSFDTCKRCVMKLSMIEHTYSCEWEVIITRMFVLNSSKSMRQSLPQSADWKSHFNLIHLFYRSIIIIPFKWMDNLMFEIFLDLPVTLLQSIEVVVEREKWRETLVTLIVLSSSINLALFKLFFVIILRFDTKSIQFSIVLLNDLNMVLIDCCLEFLDQSFHFVEVFE